VGLDQQLDIRPDCLPHSANLGDALPKLLWLDDVVHGPKRIPFQCGVAERDRSNRALGRGLRRIHSARPAVGVGLEPVAAAAPEQLVDGHAERLALDVPEGDLDPGNRGGRNRAAAHVVVRAVQELPVLLDAARIEPDQSGPQLLDRGDDCRIERSFIGGGAEGAVAHVPSGAPGDLGNLSRRQTAGAPPELADSPRDSHGDMKRTNPVGFIDGQPAPGGRQRARGAPMNAHAN